MKLLLLLRRDVKLYSLNCSWAMTSKDDVRHCIFYAGQLLLVISPKGLWPLPKRLFDNPLVIYFSWKYFFPHYCESHLLRIEDDSSFLWAVISIKAFANRPIKMRYFVFDAVIVSTRQQNVIYLISDSTQLRFRLQCQFS